MQKCIVISESYDSNQISETVNGYLRDGWAVVNMVSQVIATGIDHSVREGRIIIIIEKK